MSEEQSTMNAPPSSTAATDIEAAICELKTNIANIKKNQGSNSSCNSCCKKSLSSSSSASITSSSSLLSEAKTANKVTTAVSPDDFVDDDEKAINIIRLPQASDCIPCFCTSRLLHNPSLLKRPHYKPVSTSILQQYIPLYLAFICALTAIILSINVSTSTNFVTLTEELEPGPFFRDVRQVGLSSWELCVVKQNGLDVILDSIEEEEANNAHQEKVEVDIVSCNGMTKRECKQDNTCQWKGSNGCIDNTEVPFIQDSHDSTAIFDEVMKDGSGHVLQLPTTKKKLRTTIDMSRNVTSHVLTTYHALQSTSSSSSSSSATNMNWMNEPDHDDVLILGDYPYHDDDILYEETLYDKEIYWDCHNIQFTYSTNSDENLDTMWIASRIFFRLGSIMGVCATMLLVTLIILRIKEGMRREEYKQEVVDELLCNKSSSSNGKANKDPEKEQKARISKANRLLSLDTNASGYRPISICFLLSYLLQSLTLLFLDSSICREQVCTMSKGSYMLLTSCILWVISGLLVLYMMKRVIQNDRLVRRFKRKLGRTHPSSMQQQRDYIEDDCLLPGISSDEVDAVYAEVDASSSSKNSVNDEESALNTTVDTECSDELW